MYDKTITLFNRYESQSAVIWYPTVLKNVDLIMDKASIQKIYGQDATDTAKLHVKYQVIDGLITIGNKPWYPPKEWASHLNDELSGMLTFKSDDFFILGEYENLEPIDDEKYLDGFYNEINRKYDYCFSITSVSGAYTVIPHFEILAK